MPSCFEKKASIATGFRRAGIPPRFQGILKFRQGFLKGGTKEEKPYMGSKALCRSDRQSRRPGHTRCCMAKLAQKW